jgi:hypothetical protein
MDLIDLGARRARPGEPNHGLVDRYTPWHVVWGGIMGMSGIVSWPVALGLSIAWEILEHPLKDHVPVLFPKSTQDTLANSAGDIAANMIGWSLGHRLLHRQRRR